RRNPCSSKTLSVMANAFAYFSNSASSRINRSSCGISASIAFRIFNLVIPSEVEKSRHESLKVTQRDPSTSARDHREIYPSQKNFVGRLISGGRLFFTGQLTAVCSNTARGADAAGMGL